jgi:hypothetical protein
MQNTLYFTKKPGNKQARLFVLAEDSVRQFNLNVDSGNFSDY